MPKTKSTKDGVQSQRRKGLQSRIARACDRCRHRKLSCDPTEHSCHQCQRAGTWCTLTDPLTGVPAYRGEHEYLEHTVEKQLLLIQTLLGRLQDLGQDVSGLVDDDKQTCRYRAWRQARSDQPVRPWDTEDEKANLTRELVIQENSVPELVSSNGWSQLCSASSSLPSTQQPSPAFTHQLPLASVLQTTAPPPTVFWHQQSLAPGFDNAIVSSSFSVSYYNIGTTGGDSTCWRTVASDDGYMRCSGP